MKQYILASILFSMVCSASAVTLAWGANSAAAQVYGLSSGTQMTVGTGSQTASMTIYYFKYSDYDAIIELGQVDSSALTSYVVASAAGQTSTNTSAAGRAKASSATTSFTEAGTQFFARAYATFDGKDYFIDLFGGAGAGGVWAMTKSGDATADETLAWKEGTYGGSTSSVVGTENAWIPAAAVPEPATGALALAGIALLFKRRKARA